MKPSQSVSLTLRRPRTSEICRLVEIERKAFAAQYYRDHRLTARDFARLLGRRRTFFLVAKSKRRLVGDLIGELPASKSKRLARLDSIAVDPKWRTRRIGRRLATRFLAQARRLGYAGVTLEVAVSNRVAQRLFYELGFRRSRRLPRYYSGKIDGFRMIRTF